jgi:hypothetical protein
MLEFAGRIAAAHGVVGERSTVLVEFNSDGTVRSIRSEPIHKGGLRERANACEGAYLFYDPFEPNEYAWLEWRGIERGTVERVLGQVFTAEDFVGRRFDRPKIEEFPATWDVMF